MYYYSIDAYHLVDVGTILRSVDLCRYLSISVSEDTHDMTSSTSTPGLRPLTLLLHTTHMHATTPMVCATVVGVRMYVLLLHRCIPSSRCRYHPQV